MAARLKVSLGMAFHLSGGKGDGSQHGVEVGPFLALEDVGEDAGGVAAADAFPVGGD